MKSRMGHACAGFLVTVVVAVVMAGCSKDESTTCPSVDDVVAPSVVPDLAVVSPTTGSLALRWTATGDDKKVGTASRYDIRYSTESITDTTTWWNQATQCTGEPAPQAVGRRETFVVTGLSANTYYIFALKVGDEESNWSGVSNVAVEKTAELPGVLALGTGMNSHVKALIVYDGQLIAGGYFTTAGGVSANGIAAWDGSSWSALGSGIPTADVEALAVYGGQLIAAGSFSTAGGVGANRIAAWNGSSWSPLGSGIGGGSVYSLAVYNGQLIAGGGFSTAGGVSANNVAAWNGSSWSALSSGTDDMVLALAAYGPWLVAGGGFTAAGGVSATRIAAWNGGTWQSMGSPWDGYIYALAICDGQLYAAGDFLTAAGVSANHIAMRLRALEWLALAEGTNGAVYALAEYRGRLIVGGGFTTAGIYPAGYSAIWGDFWLGWYGPSGMLLNGNVYALTVYNGQLIAGGSFSRAGSGTGISANSIVGYHY